MPARYSQVNFTLRCMFPRWSHWEAEYTPKGLMKLRLRRSIKYGVLLLTAFGIYRMRKLGLTLGSLGPLLKEYARSVLVTLQSVIVGGLEALQHRL